MNLDDPVCLCYHVSLRKLLNFAARERPARPSGMSQCLGAGTGCGWCIPILTRIQQETVAGGQDARSDGLMSRLPESEAAYAEARKEYLRSDRKNAF